MKRNNCMADHNINLLYVMEIHHVVNGKYTSRQRNLNINEHFEKINLENLRRRREIECFSIINRGLLWYSSLTDEQNIELNAWYHKWLDVTETKIIPDPLKWIKPLKE